MMTEALKGRCRLLEARFVLDFKADGLVRGIAFRVAKRMRAVVRSQIQRLLAALRHLQPKATGRERLR